MIFGPAQVVPFSVAAGETDVIVTPVICHGWAIIESTGTTAAEIGIYDGPLGALIAPFSLCPGESARDWLSGAGIYAEQGLTVRVISGSVEGSLWYRSAIVPAVHAPVSIPDLLDQVLEMLFDARR